ncbi:hypothetical protein ATANTOWER_009405 [Ataeniobius toweri]|uniref:PH domain-containing protein n=1 Tax=Ataeniobius toweri TaxID=208326 RepID=A0ABU7AIT7_9TELE|nr:hypothetical protein [Ataeniobius toweri]
MKTGKVKEEGGEQNKEQGPHPCIQKESPYMKFLCCEDKQTLLLWVNSIRIAKYGTALLQQRGKSNSHTSLESPYPGPLVKSNEGVPSESPSDFIHPPPSG